MRSAKETVLWGKSYGQKPISSTRNLSPRGWLRVSSRLQAGQWQTQGLTFVAELYASIDEDTVGGSALTRHTGVCCQSQNLPKPIPANFSVRPIEPQHNGDTRPGRKCS